MRQRIARRPRMAALLLAAACGHSEPFTTPDQEIDGAFEADEPLRLTYSPLGDHEPGLSTDGHWVTYQFERGNNDQDRCIAVLHPGGGQRQRELCAWSLTEAGRSDGLANAALRGDGTMAFTLHSGTIGNMTSTAAGLFVGPIDSIAGSVEVLTLPQSPPGAQRIWQDLMDPVWVSDDELLVLAGERFLANGTGACEPLDCEGDWIPYDMDRTPLRDTVPVGLELARIRIRDGAASVVHSLPVPNSSGWSYDASSGKAYVVSRDIHRLDDMFLESLADTVYAVDLALGQFTMLYGTSRVNGERYLERIHGIASAQGRIFVSRSWRSTALVNAPNILPGAALNSDIAELMPDGTLRAVAPAVSWRWGRLRLASDARVLYAEAVERTGSDIYRIQLNP